jgi:hypothetical protein
VEDGRRRREANAVAIRKDKKEEGISKRRNLNVTEDVDVKLNEFQFGDDRSSIKKKLYSVADIPTLLAGLSSPSVEIQVENLRGFRRLLSSERNAPVQECIDCGAIPKFVAFLQRTDSAELQFEAAWALTNIASSDKTRVVVEYNAVPHLARLLLSEHAEIREQVRQKNIIVWYPYFCIATCNRQYSNVVSSTSLFAVCLVFRKRSRRLC